MFKKQTRECILTFNNNIVEKQFIKTLKKDSAHRRDSTLCPCKGPIKELFNHEVGILEKLKGKNNFPQILRKDNDKLSFKISYVGKSINMLKKEGVDLKTIIPKNWIEQVVYISNCLNSLDIYHNDICGNNICILDDKIYLIDFVCTQPLSRKVNDGRDNINDLIKFFSKELKITIDNNIFKYKNINIGVAISTYTEEKTDKERYSIIKKSLDSLENYLKNTILNVFVVIVVDGPIPQIHHDLLNNYSFNVYFKTINKGVSCVKNTSIRILLEKKVDIGFLCDDDILYKPMCLEKYVDAMVKGSLSHMGFCQMNPIVDLPETWNKRGFIKVKINQAEVMKHKGRGVGCLLTFTPDLIKKIGYFKVFPGTYGYEHINFTYRCIHQGFIPHATDILNSLNYIDHISFEPVGEKKYKKTHSISEELRVKENNKNKNLYLNDLSSYVECIE